VLGDKRDERDPGEGADEQERERRTKNEDGGHLEHTTNTDIFEYSPFFNFSSEEFEAHFAFCFFFSWGRLVVAGSSSCLAPQQLLLHA
jgi:hypothetical protein